MSENTRPDKRIEKEKPIIKKGVTGHVKWYSVRDNYGFIGRDDDENDVFVHQSSILQSSIRNRKYRTLADGESVEFDIVEGRKGFEAVNITGPNGTNVRGIPVIIVQDGHNRQPTIRFQRNLGRDSKFRRDRRDRRRRSESREAASRPEIRKSSLGSTSLSPASRDESTKENRSTKDTQHDKIHEPTVNDNGIEKSLSEIKVA